MAAGSGRRFAPASASAARGGEATRSPRVTVATGPTFAWTSRAHGDLAGPDPVLPDALLPAAPRPWTTLHQVHGADVVVVTRPGEHAGVDADAAVTATLGCAIAVRTADCAPIVLLGRRSVGVVHAGWRGLQAGVVAAAVGAVRALDDEVVAAHLGPCIRAGCYEFTGSEREDLVARFGSTVAATTVWGTPALDVPAAVAVALEELGVPELRDDAGCTACDRRWFSHRARGEVGRLATVAWLPPS